MKKSKILQQDRDSLVALAKRMTPEERLVAYANHAQLINQMYQAGVKHRAGRVPSPKRKNPKRP